MNSNLDADVKFALVVAERGKHEIGGGNVHLSNWQTFLSNIHNNAYPPKDATKIHENIWLIPLSSGLPFLGDLIRRATNDGVSIRVLFLAEAPNWIKYPPDAEAKPS
jgi:hypothetical protein